MYAVTQALAHRDKQTLPVTFGGSHQASWRGARRLRQHLLLVIVRLEHLRGPRRTNLPQRLRSRLQARHCCARDQGLPWEPRSRPYAGACPPVAHERSCSGIPCVAGGGPAAHASYSSSSSPHLPPGIQRIALSPLFLFPAAWRRRRRSSRLSTPTAASARRASCPPGIAPPSACR